MTAVSPTLRLIARKGWALRWLSVLALLFAGSTVRSADLRITRLVMAPSSSGILQLELGISQPVVGAQLDLLYPSTQFALGTAQRGGALSSHVLKAADVAPGRRRFIVYSPQNQPLSGGVLAEIPISHVGAATVGTFSLSLANALVVTPTGLADQPLNLFAGDVLLGSDVPPVLAPLPFSAGGPIRFLLEGADGRTYQIEASTDLRTWTDLLQVTVVDGQAVIDDLPQATLTQRFYRARLLP